MLNVELAEKFIEKIVTYTDYNVNIMNDQGIIIASRDKTRVGTFHEIAYQIINEGKDMIEVEEDNAYLGTRKGLNMPFFHKKRKIGVIGVTGNPQEVRSLAMIIRMSLETMLEYELSQEKLYQRKGTKEYFINCLMYHKTDKKELNELCHMLGYENQILRIPILIQLKEDNDLERMLYKIKEGNSHSKQDISAITREKQIIIFKTINGNFEDFYKDYKFAIGEYLSCFLNYIREKDIVCHFYVGSVQNKLENYRFAYQHCKWLTLQNSKNNIGMYFYDYVGLYLKSKTPFLEMHQAYNVFDEFLDHKTKKSIIEMIAPMTNNNYNLIETSKELFIHRNTLVFRMNKIKDYFNLNPIQNYQDREFLSYLCRYLSDVKK
jgi:carbohydrate diacid regulator